MDLLYETYVIAKLGEKSGEKFDAENSGLQEISASSHHDNSVGSQAQERQILSLIGDPVSLYNMARAVGTSVAGIMAFISANSDVLTALGIISQLEARTQYDPRFRNSIPRVIRDNAPNWIL